MTIPKKLFDFKAFGRIYNDTQLDTYQVNVDGFAINGTVVGITDLDPGLIDDLETSLLEAIYQVESSPSIVLGPTWVDNEDGTATVTFTTNVPCFSGIDYGSSPSTYTSSAFNYSTYPTLESTTSHVIQVPEVGTLNGTFYYKVWVGTETYSDYVGIEQTGQIS